MKPLKIEFQAFGPYSGREEVDFEKLASKGLFLICGKTGIGKTMILDAMTFALYGSSSGNMRNDFSAMRCTKADFDTATFVKFTFENNGDYYIFERRLERKRKNLSAQYNAMKMDNDGVYKPLFENPKDKMLNDKAVEIIGLDYDQFRQVIVLPQGQFEKLLTSDSSEKEKILTNIFGEQKWQAIADRVYEEASGRKDALRDKKDRIYRSLQDEKCETMAELSLLIEGKNRELTELSRAFEKGRYDEKSASLQAQLTLAKRFGDLKKAMEKVALLEEKKDYFAGLEKQLSDALRAGKVRTFLDDEKEAAAEVKVRETRESDARRKAETARVECETAEKLLESLLGLDKEIEEKKAQKIKYEEKRSVYEKIDKVKGELEKARLELENAEKSEKTASKKYDERNLYLGEVRKTYDSLCAEHKELLDAYLAGITGVIASTLKDEEPCPVCGSTSHPHKAELTEDSVSKEEVDLKKEEVDKEYGKLQDVILRQEEAKNLLDAKHDETEKRRGEMAVVSSGYESMRSNLPEGIDSLKALDETIELLKGQIEEHSGKKSECEKSVREKREAFTAEKAKIEPAAAETLQAKERLEEAKASADKAVSDNGFESVDEVRGLLLSDLQAEELNRQISDYKVSVSAAKTSAEELKRELEGMQEPDVSACNEVLAEISRAKSEYAEKKGILSTEINRLDEKRSKLEGEGDGIEEKIRQAEEDFIFAKKLRGDSGTGLQRYVLGIMFSSVVAAANKMLEMVHGGRYRLYRSDDKVQGSNKRGLELKVFDKLSENHEGRFVNTLSGGEKFLASLALSIGMSTVAVGTGIRIEVLFIDEGFGSLDEDSISDAMDILNSIREANGLVGIISHVGLLQDRIPTKLRVVSDEKGSHILQTLG